MTKPITGPQFDALWLDEFLSDRHHCILCGNSGRIDTRGKVWTPAGYPAGGKALCICPNGRAMKRQGAKP